MKCTLCSAPLTIKRDKYFYNCGTCKAIIKDKQYYISPEAEKARYETHNNDVNDIGYQNFTSPITNYVLENFKPHHRGLDFGSGTGPVISSMLKKQKYDIVQYDPFFAPNQNVLSNSYDYIVCCEVFEHFHNPKMEINRLTFMLNSNGHLLIMTMLYDDHIDFKTWNYRNDPTHVIIYRKETIKYLAENNGFEICVLTDRFIAMNK